MFINSSSLECNRSVWASFDDLGYFHRRTWMIWNLSVQSERQLDWSKCIAYCCLCYLFGNWNFYRIKWFFVGGIHIIPPSKPIYAWLRTLIGTVIFKRAQHVYQLLSFVICVVICPPLRLKGLNFIWILDCNKCCARPEHNFVIVFRIEDECARIFGAWGVF